MNNIRNNLNFKADMIFSSMGQLKENNQRWQMITNEFNTDTCGIKDNIRLNLIEVGDYNRQLIISRYDKQNPYDQINTTLEAPTYRKLLELDDSEIVNKMKKILVAENKSSNDLEDDLKKISEKYNLKKESKELLNEVVRNEQYSGIESNFKNDEVLNGIHFYS